METKREPLIIKSQLFKNFVIWTVVCSLCAAYSFVVALDMGHDPLALVLGVLVFVVFYSVFASTSFFENRIRKNKILFSAFVAGFVIKLAVTYPVDFYTGVMAIDLVDSGFGRLPNAFFLTFLATLTEGVLLNAMIWTVVLLIFCAHLGYTRLRQRMSM